MNIRLLFCDLNGTVLDDMPVWAQAMRATFRAFGTEPPSIADWFRELETGDYLEVYRRRGITASREELNAIYEPAYAARLAGVRPEVGMQAALHTIHSTGVKLALLTLQPESLAKPLLDQFGLTWAFSALAFHTLDKKAVIARIATDYGIPPEECAFVGDAPSDMRHAKAAGVKPIAFLNGYVPSELMRATEPWRCVTIAAHLAKLF